MNKTVKYITIFLTIVYCSKLFMKNPDGTPMATPISLVQGLLPAGMAASVGDLFGAPPPSTMTASEAVAGATNSMLNVLKSAAAPSANVLNGQANPTSANPLERIEGMQETKQKAEEIQEQLQKSLQERDKALQGI